MKAIRRMFVSESVDGPEVEGPYPSEEDLEADEPEEEGVDADFDPDEKIHPDTSDDPGVGGNDGTEGRLNP